jgi:PIN domain nuclease of toxin-antitoxin system
VNLLIDAHVLCWWIADQPELADGARAAIADPDNIVGVSAATIWELAIKQAAGRLEFDGDFREELEANRFDILPIGLDHALAAATLPQHHSDPFDRMLVAQAQIERLTIVTRDRRIPQYGVPVLAA